MFYISHTFNRTMSQLVNWKLEFVQNYRKCLYDLCHEIAAVHLQNF